jgi:hypothetical protein
MRAKRDKTDHIEDSSETLPPITMLSAALIRLAFSFFYKKMQLIEATPTEHRGEQVNLKWSTI